LSTKLTLVQQKVLARVNQCSRKIKQTNSNAKLATKHCIFATSISARPTSSMKDIARVLCVHHCNVSNVMERPKVFSDCGVVLWTLSFQRKRIDGCTNEDKDAAITWWASKIRVNPNKRDVTR
jgi:hypothetical protein